DGYIESKDLKATMTQPYAYDSGVNRNHRPRVSASSREDREDTYRRSRSRTRSRSPYRHRSPPPRADNRRRRGAEDLPERNRFNDSRSFKPRHEGERSHGHDRRRIVAYDDIDSSENHRRSTNFTDRPDSHGRDLHQGKRRRIGSRSPEQPYGRSQDSRHAGNDRNRAQKHEAEPQERWGSSNRRSRDQHEHMGRSSNQHDTAMSDAVATNHEYADPEPVDEDAIIEQRRKARAERKAAIAARLEKEQGQGSPLHAEVASNLGLDSMASSPKTDTPEVSPMMSPRTPGRDSTPGSPAAFSIENGEQLANRLHGDTDADGPAGVSAADYDPSMDMQEDRFKDVQQHHEEDLAAAQRKGEPDEHEVSVADASDDMFATNFEIEPAKPSATTQVSGNRGDNWTDEQGFYRVIGGELLNDRYKVRSILGGGTFAKVVESVDQKNNNELVAVKIIRNNHAMKQEGLKEIAMLERLGEADPDGKRHVIHLKETFSHHGHLCLVFPLLNMNLREVVKKYGRDIGLNLNGIRTYATQMFRALHFLRSLGIVHGDIKPDNILIDEKLSGLYICDLGSAVDMSESEVRQYFVSRFYRAPELILGLAFTPAIDMWSIGCTLFELFTGKICFTGQKNNNMLLSIMETCGPFSMKWLKKCDYAGQFFDDDGTFNLVDIDKFTGKAVVRKMVIPKKPTRDLKSRMLKGVKASDKLSEAELRDINLFIDLVDKCLNINPDKRLTPQEALEHPFIRRVAFAPKMVSKKLAAGAALKPVGGLNRYR
ncbi:kinase-like protein, partial [Saccharata proteae CBS 121410]